VRGCTVHVILTKFAYLSTVTSQAFFQHTFALHHNRTIGITESGQNYSLGMLEQYRDLSNGIQIREMGQSTRKNRKIFQSFQHLSYPALFWSVLKKLWRLI
jgi:hypothetical protein